jgi:hypothetical protein
MHDFERSRLQEESGELKGHLPAIMGKGNTGIQDREGVQDRKERHPLVNAMKN